MNFADEMRKITQEALEQQEAVKKARAEATLKMLKDSGAFNLITDMLTSFAKDGRSNATLDVDSLQSEGKLPEHLHVIDLAGALQLEGFKATPQGTLSVYVNWKEYEE
jgi:hypothetical protein